MIDLKTRESWDKQLANMTSYFQETRKAKDGSDYIYRRLSFTYLSPASLIVSDRDFYVQELIRYDFPVKGAVCLYMRNIPETDEYPLDPYKVRA